MTREPLALAMVAALMIGAAAAAEDTSAATLLAENCRAEPADPAQPPAGGQNDHADATRRTAPDSLTDTLDPCNGVLVPPRVGDGEMIAPPPTEGRTPVIRPGVIPDQPPSRQLPAE